MAIRDREGNEYVEAGVNQFQQRQLRCVSGPRKGEMILDPRCGAPPESRTPYERPITDPWLRAIHEPTDFSKW
jgi:hypothetical protein